MSQSTVKMYDFSQAVPTIRELYDYVVKRVSYKWEGLGIYLDLDQDGAKLEAIRRSFVLLGVDICCLQLFILWLREGRKEVVVWDTVFTALENIGSHGVVKEIKAKLEGEKLAP